MISGRIFSPSFLTRSPNVLAAICQQTGGQPHTQGLQTQVPTQQLQNEAPKLTGLT